MCYLTTPSVPKALWRQWHINVGLNVGVWCSYNDSVRPRYSKHNLSHCHFVHVEWPGIELEPPRREALD